MKKIITIVLISLFALTGCFLDKYTETNEVEVDVQNYTIGETFKFQTFEITIGNPEIVPIPEMYSSMVSSSDVIKIPINIKNVGDSHARLFEKFFDAFDYDDNRLTKATFYFDDSMTLADLIEPEKSIDRNLYYEYTGKDNYKIVFESKFQKFTIDLPINK